MKRLGAFALLCAISFAAVAGGEVDRKPLEIAAVVAQQKEIRDGVLAKTGRYKDMSDSTRIELLSRQAELLIMLEGKQSAADLTTEQQAHAFNMLEWIESAINNTDDDRMICRREKALGSTRTTRVCRTAAQEREAKERARQELDMINHSQSRR